MSHDLRRVAAHHGSTRVPFDLRSYARTRVALMWRTDREPVDLDGIDIHDALVDTVTAAALAGVEPKTISMWKTRGHLDVAARDASGRPRYRPIDVAKAEAKTRRTQQSRRSS